MKRRKHVLDDLDRDIQDHIERETADNIDRGMTLDEARTAALRRFGNIARVKEDIREVWTTMWFDRFIQDLRFGCRMLAKSPAFTAVAVLTLALGIGANTVVFSVVNAFLLHPLNVPQADSLYQIERGKDKNGMQSYPDYLELRDRNRSFEDLAAYAIAQVGLDSGENPSRAWINMVSGNYFDALKLRPQLGRFFHAADEHGPNSAPYIVLSYGYWHSHFHEDPGVVNQVVRVNKHPFTILGVAPPDLQGMVLFIYPDFYVPIVNQQQVDSSLGPGNLLDVRGNHWVFMVMGHLRPGVTTAQAVADLNSIGGDLEKTYPNDDAQMTFTLASPALYGDLLGPPVRAFLTGLMLLAVLILLAACANLGSLFAARAADRSREVALRLALGATRYRILRQLFTEAMLISFIGGTAGIAGSVFLLHSLSLWQPFPRWPIHVPVNPDVSVYAAGLLLTVVSGFLFGSVPVRQTLRTDPYQIVKSGSVIAIGRRVTARDLLLVAQLAISAVLITSSMVAVRGLIRSLRTDFGFEPQNAMLIETDVAMAGYTDDHVAPFQRRMIEVIERISGVDSVGLIDQLPLWGGTSTAAVFTDEAVDLRPGNAAAMAVLYRISPGYLQAAGTTILSGENITWHDDKSVPRVAVVNQEFARRMFGTVANATGRYYKLKGGQRVEVVGVAQDGKYTSLTEQPQPAMFLPILQSASSSTWLVVRSNRDPQELGAAIQGTLRELDSGLPFEIHTWNRELEDSTVLFGPRMATLALGVLGAMGALLSVTGVFGMAAYSVSKRMRELGIRVALGAQRGQVLNAALGRALRLLALGSIAGLVLGIQASRVLAFIVYQATPLDPIVLGGVVVVMLVLGLIATWIPAHRAVSADPLRLLREE